MVLKMVTKKILEKLILQKYELKESLEDLENSKFYNDNIELKCALKTQYEDDISFIDGIINDILNIPRAQQVI